ncbi:unnamed protein product [Mytilus edulis]|uniref:FZ domain-containing protein n=1 Tax=Mytilus edulis TaxID=6550 RepID=A0A8S3V078_MYTED|nr:unnamed protein product [Mytilus edulis]
MTTFPNTLGHRSQTEATQDLKAIWPLVEIGCSASLREFLCSYYFPKCDPAVKEILTILPSRYLCENSRKGCEPLMNKFGFPWPSNFECHKFPGGCEPTTIPMCAQKLKKTKFPNRFGHKNQHEAGLEVNKFYIFVVAGCSDFFQDFLCSVYFPKCNPQVDSERWNQLLCNTVRAGCEPIMNEIGMDWPNELSCEQFTSG